MVGCWYRGPPWDRLCWWSSRRDLYRCFAGIYSCCSRSRALGDLLCNAWLKNSLDILVRIFNTSLDLMDWRVHRGETLLSCLLLLDFFHSCFLLLFENPIEELLTKSVDWCIFLTLLALNYRICLCSPRWILVWRCVRWPPNSLAWLLLLSPSIFIRIITFFAHSLDNSWTNISLCWWLWYPGCFFIRVEMLLKLVFEWGLQVFLKLILLCFDWFPSYWLLFILFCFVLTIFQTFALKLRSF